MKKIFVPSRSQRNLSLGLFQANSLGSIQQPTEKVDMGTAKAAVRYNRRVRSGEIRQEMAVKAKVRRLKSWWKYRQNWRSARVGDRSGKQHPHIRGRVEFPDGTVGWLH